MNIEKVFIREVDPGVEPENQRLVVMLSSGRYEAMPIHLGQHPKSLAYNLIDLAERLMRQSNKEFEND